MVLRGKSYLRGRSCLRDYYHGSELDYNAKTVLRGSFVVRSLVYCDCVIKIYVGINATAQDVFSICIKLFGVLIGVIRISVGVNATAQEVFSIA